MADCKILIVDDEAPARRRLVELLADLQPTCANQVVGQADNARTALEMAMQLQPDVILLDIQMPEMTGLELAQHFLQLEWTWPPAIIFVTAYDEYALQAFEVHAQDYLLKPVRASRLEEALKRAQAQRSFRLTSASALASPPATSPTSAEESSSRSAGADKRPALPPVRRHCFSILEKNRVLLVPVADVLFLKAEQKYLTVHTKERDYLLEESLNTIEQEMSDRLVRVHRNALVARDAIIGVERAPTMHDVEIDSNHKAGQHGSEKTGDAWQVILRDCAERLPISRRQWPTIKALVR